MITAHPEGQRVNTANLYIARSLFDLVQNEIAPGTGIEPAEFWLALAKTLEQLSHVNDALLAERDSMQTMIDNWHRQRHGKPHDHDEYLAFLQEINYLLPEKESFAINPQGVDPEIASISGPQLVVPVNNARYALNAANARWGSLFDALYGTDAMGDELPGGKEFDTARGAKVVAYAMSLLDEVAPLTEGSHADVTEYFVQGQQLNARLYSGTECQLTSPEKFVGYNKAGDSVSAVLLRNNNLHIEISIEHTHAVCDLSRACIRDLIMESAITTIQDCEDSVAAVDAEDKVLGYRNWLQLMKGELQATFFKNGKTHVRTLNPDRNYLAPDGSPFVLHGRSLMLNRNVGHHMTTDAVLDANGNEIYEGILDCMITAFCALHDVQGQSPLRNSATGSIYIVKPKMHGPAETTFMVELLSCVETALSLKPSTIKLGMMDEERRTTLNLKECLRIASDRIIFINTGFLDRTGDEIHTSMEAGTMIRKQDMKSAAWLQAYEDWNVAVGLDCGMLGRAQIGKGMWTKPDMMNDMLQSKGKHLLAGASCAWVPSPTAATLHAIHYHRINVQQRQQELLQRHPVSLKDLLTIPVEEHPQWSTYEIQQELDNNLHSILGYVVRWVEQGIGASKVPDMNHIGLMEDRATLRISSQHVANWLHHGIVSEQQVLDTLKSMAQIVDEQNAGDPHYINMAPKFDGPAFNAAKELVFKGRDLPNGYTIAVLKHWRQIHKSNAQ